MLLPHDPTADRLALEQLALWCQQFAPLVGLEDGPFPAALLLDVTGCQRLYRGEDRLARLVAHAFQQHGWAAHVAVADTLGAAWAAAHYGHSSPATPVRIPPGETQAALHGWPVAALRLPADTVATLWELGLHTIGDLRALPRASLPVRLGPEVLDRLDQALGHLPEVFTPVRPPPPLQIQHTFEDPLEHRLALEAVLEQQLEQLLAPARQLGRGVHKVRLALSVATPPGDAQSPPAPAFPSSPSHSPPAPGQPRDSAPVEPRPAKVSPAIQLRIPLFAPTTSLRHLLEVIRLRLDKIAWPGAITQIHVRVATAPQERWQHRLFGGRETAATRQFALLVDRLAGRLGRQAVLRPCATGEPLPELACRWEPLVGHSSRGGSSANKTSPRRRRPAATQAFPTDGQPWRKGGGTPPPRSRPVRGRPLPCDWKTAPVRSAAARPGRLLGTPRPAVVMSVQPDGPPIRLTWQGREHVVHRWWGPERIETGWWRPRGSRREYYRVETRTGERFWLFRRPQGDWFVQGEWA